MKKLSFTYFLIVVIILSCISISGYSCKKAEKNKGEESKITDSIKIANLSNPREVKKNIEIDSTCNLVIYKPNFSKVHLVCIDRPSKDNDSIIMMIAGAYTGKRLEKFDHNNICGSHTSKSIYYERPFMERLTGTFSYSNGKPAFYYKEDSEKILKEAAMQGGSGFMQEMIIHADTIVPQTRALTDTAQFRALSLLNDKLVIVEANRIIEYRLFIDALKSLGVKEAIYTDMGNGWNYSWYRDNDGKVVELHPGPYKYSSNWIVFYK